MKIVFRIILAFILVGAVLGLGAFAFRAGYMQGAVQNLAAQPQVDGAPLAYPMMRPYMYHYPHFGFSPFGFLAPLFFLFLIFAALRGLFWRGRWGHPMGHPMHHHGRWGMGSMGGDWDHEKGVPPFFVEWHNRAHAQPQSESKPSEPEKPAE